MYVNESNQNLWDFEVLEGITFLNCNRIHPLKQKEIQILVDACDRDEYIQELIVFGSSTEFRCNSHSDIDLVVIRKDNKVEVPEDFFIINSEVDILFSVGEQLKEILWEHGVTVFRR